MRIIPSDTLYVKIDKEAVKKSGMLMASDTIPDKMVISLAGKRMLGKGQLMMLEMIAQCNWTRPLYVATTVGADNYMNLGDNFVQEGLAYRITPFTTKNPGVKSFDTEKAYNNLMYRYKWGGLEKPGLYLDETVMRMCYTHRHLFAMLALELINEGKKDKAIKVLDKSLKVIPEYNVPMTFMSGASELARAYALAGQKAKAAKLLNAVWKNEEQYALWYLSLEGTRFTQAQNDFLRQTIMMQSTAELTSLVDEKLASKRMQRLNALYTAYRNKGGAELN